MFFAGKNKLIVLNNITLEIKKGETIALLGVSGSGKTTLLGLLAGIDIPTSGNILLGGNNISSSSENFRAKVRAGNIGFVFQNFELLNNLTALENVMLPLEFLGESGTTVKALELLDKVGLKDRANHYPSELSGGEQQRVSIARAYITNPKVLFADEPTGNLDEKTGSKIINLLFELNKNNNSTLVIATHDKTLAQHCSRVLYLASGNLTTK